MLTGKEFHHIKSDEVTNEIFKLASDLLTLDPALRNDHAKYLDLDHGNGSEHKNGTRKIMALLGPCSDNSPRLCLVDLACLYQCLL